MKEIKFVKMHGAGNDYVYVNCFSEQITNPVELAVKFSDRHKGIGSDGLVLIMPSETCDLKMRMFNADGSEAQMCGNASRCIAKFAYEYGLVDKKLITLETKAGEKKLKLVTDADNKVKTVTVDMGEPILAGKDIPVKSAHERVINHKIEAEGEVFNVSCVSMGNPHAVIFVEEVDAVDITKGKLVENHPFFPEKTNVEFIERITTTQLKMRVWERGSGETLACGTGACAALVASVLNGVACRKAVINLLGGDLEVEWNKSNNRVYMTGEAEIVFEGSILVDE